MKKMKTNLLVVITLILSSGIGAQELTSVTRSSVNVEQLPEYIIVTSENTKLFGGIDISIDYKKSEYADVLSELESLLQNRNKLKIRNQTDLLNALSKLGFEYVDSYNASAGSLGIGGGDDVEVFGSQAKYRINMVFRKKVEMR